MARRVAAGMGTLCLRGLWCEDRPAALWRAAPAPVELLVLGRVIVRSFVLIVVDELRTGRNCLDRLDEDPLAIVDRLAVRIAGVIDETGFVAVDRRVDHRLVVHREQKRVVARHLIVIVSLVRRAPGDALTEILDDPCSLADRANGEGTSALDLRRAELEIGIRLLLPRIASVDPALRSGGWRVARLRGSGALARLRALSFRRHASVQLGTRL